MEGVLTNTTPEEPLSSITKLHKYADTAPSIVEQPDSVVKTELESDNYTNKAIEDEKNSNDNTKGDITEEKDSNIHSRKCIEEERQRDKNSHRGIIPTTSLATNPEFTIPLDHCEAYNNLFLIIHNMPPNISILPLAVSLPRVEILLDLSSKYSNLPFIRSSVSNELFQYGRELYLAIKSDPVRWLKIALALQCKLIFREAVIHIAGQFPHIPVTEDPDFIYQDDLLKFLNSKAQEIHYLKSRVDMDLFTSDIYVGEEPLSLRNLDNTTLTTWLVIQAWRDWFVQYSPPGTDPEKMELTAADRYRIMAKAGDSYLSTESVLLSLEKHFDLKLEEEEVENLKEDLRTMKTTAQSLVKPLVVNHSMLDVESADIHYLTCVTVEDDELPWITIKDLQAP